MAINTTVYGTPEQWQDVHTYDDSIESKDRVKAVYYGGANYYDNNLRLGNSTGKTPINHAIDKSLSYCGLGNESAFSKLKYYDIIDIQDANIGDTIEPFFAENRQITNFAFTIGNSNRPVEQTFLNARNTTNGNNARYAPTTGNIDSNTSRLAWFLSYFSFNNFIALIYVHCFNGTFTDGRPTNGEKVTLYNYENDVNSVRTNKPYIYAVTIQPFTRYNANNDRMAMQATAEGKAIEILDSYNGGTSEAGAPFYTYGALQNDNDGEFLIHGLVTGRGTASMHSGIAIPPEHTIFQIASIPDTWILKLTKKNSSYVNQQTVREYDETFYEECMHAVACFGLFFTDKLEIAQNGALDSDDMYCGVLVDGVGHGNYVHGQDNKKQPQYNKTSNDIGYDPYNPPYVDSNIYGTSDSFNPVSLADGTLKRYVLDDAGMALLNKYLWDVIDTTDPDALIQNQTLTNFLTNNPLDCIVNIKRFPFDDMSQGALTNIRLGKITVPNTSAKPFDADSVTRSCGSVRIPDFFGDWRNYICKYTLVLPFCGSIDLPAEIVTGRDVEVKYTIDYTTGTCTAFALITDDSSKYKNSGNGLIAIDSASGNCSIDIPVSGIQTATLNSEIYNANENLKASKFNNMVNAVHQTVSVAESASSGSKTRTFDSLLTLAQMGVNAVHSASVAEWNINNTEIPTKLIGASSGCNALQFNLTPRVVCYVPVTDSAYNGEKYAHSVGFACCESNTLSAYSDGEASRNYIEVSNVDLSGISGATATEKDMIISALSGGVYI